LSQGDEHAHPTDDASTVGFALRPLYTAKDDAGCLSPKPNARVAVFYSFGEGLEGGAYCDNHSIKNLLHLHSLLAYEMNYQPLNDGHGALLRLRVENQLGFKMVKWIRAIEFVESAASFGAGEGGYNEDHDYFGELANI